VIYFSFFVIQGSVLIWDQRVIHGTAPNQSYRCRLAQYLKAFPRNLTFPTSETSSNMDVKDGNDLNSIAVNPRLLKRSKAICGKLEETNQLVNVNEVGQYLFGLDILK
jgi:ectoine hydroxylase-related dioxygenase (phytanoyl-CoA dioxygenase family)